jgi:hypothetical protein
MNSFVDLSVLRGWRSSLFERHKGPLPSGSQKADRLIEHRLVGHRLVEPSLCAFLFSSLVLFFLRPYRLTMPNVTAAPEAPMFSMDTARSIL